MQSFYIGGGQNPASVLAGFDNQILKSALNVRIHLLPHSVDGMIIASLINRHT